MNTIGGETHYGLEVKNLVSSCGCYLKLCKFKRKEPSGSVEGSILKFVKLFRRKHRQGQTDHAVKAVHCHGYNGRLCHSGNNTDPRRSPC